jgi:ribosomal protein S21
MIEVKRNENESTSNLIKRFTKKVKESSFLTRARGLRYKTRPKSELKTKQEALKKIKLGKKLDYLRKLGKIE